jgi:hypothetical protein
LQTGVIDDDSHIRRTAIKRKRKPAEINGKRIGWERSWEIWILLFEHPPKPAGVEIVIRVLRVNSGKPNISRVKMREIRRIVTDSLNYGKRAVLEHLEKTAFISVRKAGIEINIPLIKIGKRRFCNTDIRAQIVIIIVVRRDNGIQPVIAAKKLDENEDIAISALWLELTEQLQRRRRPGIRFAEQHRRHRRRCECALEKGSSFHNSNE